MIETSMNLIEVTKLEECIARDWRRISLAPPVIVAREIAPDVYESVEVYDSASDQHIATVRSEHDFERLLDQTPGTERPAENEGKEVRPTCEARETE